MTNRITAGVTALIFVGLIATGAVGAQQPQVAAAQGGAQGGRQGGRGAAAFAPRALPFRRL